MGTTLGRTLGTTLGTTAGGTQHTARSLVDRSWATNPARECSTGLADPDVAAAVSKFSTRHLRGVTNASVRQRVCVRLALNGATPTHVHGGAPRPVYGHGYPPTR